MAITVMAETVAPQRVSLRVAAEEPSPITTSATLVPKPKASRVSAPPSAVASPIAFINAAYTRPQGTRGNQLSHRPQKPPRKREAAPALRCGAKAEQGHPGDDHGDAGDDGRNVFDSGQPPYPAHGPAQQPGDRAEQHVGKRPAGVIGQVHGQEGPPRGPGVGGHAIGQHDGSAHQHAMQTANKAEGQGEIEIAGSHDPS